eukprot:gene32950-39851_t
MNLLKDPNGYKEVFDDIYVFLPTTSLSNIKDSPYEKIPENQIYDELNYDNLAEVYEKVSETAAGNIDIEKDKDKKRSLIIFDDVSSELKNKSIQQMLKKIIKNQRHLFVSSIYILQSYFDMPKQLRLVCNNLFLFKMSKEKADRGINHFFKKDIPHAVHDVRGQLALGARRTKEGGVLAAPFSAGTSLALESAAIANSSANDIRKKANKASQQINARFQTGQQKMNDVVSNINRKARDGLAVGGQKAKKELRRTALQLHNNLTSLADSIPVPQTNRISDMAADNDADTMTFH